ncbi:alkaline phosphatase family protein [Microcella alkalica]|uniref:Putative AlkP superfamily pyrophosphatase or phosphodiesterase n=1 Tax=Microcella alkalica TaxID=355930 RepID=A0A839E9Y0_9MICO|nr:alkaline phosphatase family protein [Microcella alkalica]MBA8847004.1 putative AlkP superfamily pyrophosphatase or phosphodiesterase [Microcella alkalica]
MLPAPRRDTPSLGHVLTGSLAAIRGEENGLATPPVRSAAVILVDGLGMSALRARSGHARRLMAAIAGKRGTIDAGFPTTTAAALATLTTGLQPGEHGLVGYSALDRAGDRVVNQLTGWDEGMRPAEWQPHLTLFQSAAASGIDAVVVGSERYRDTGFTDAVLRGARFVAESSIADRIRTTVALLEAPGSTLVYCYVPELDMVGHAEGSESVGWMERLEELDAALEPLARRVPRDAGVLLTADHGMLDVPEHARLVIDARSPLWSGVRHVAGEPRCLHLALQPDADAAGALARWRAAEGSRSWIVSRDEAIAADWFGHVAPEVAPRIGDVLVAARSRVAYYDERTATPRALAMVGQHGSFSPEETRIPLARWGAFAL